MKSRRVVIRNAQEFFYFCKVQFKHTSCDPSKSGQNFIQEFFFIDEISRDDSEVVAVTTEHTHSYYSIRSTGQFCVIEFREVSCCCDSCLFRNGKECPNQAYVSKWKAINLHTGKAVVAETFKNLHWDLISISDPDESNAESNTASDPEPQMYNYSENDNNADRESSDTDNESLTPFDFDSVHREIQNCATFSELEQYIDTLDLRQLSNLEKPVLQVRCNAKVDKIAVQALPTDAPSGFLPIETTGDGNCFPWAVSRAIFGDESWHQEIRLRLVIEGVQNKSHYLNNDYLSLGVTHIHR